MNAIHDAVLSEMNEQLKNKRDLMLKTLHFEMTHEECIHLIAPASNIDLLCNAAQIADIKASEGWMEVQVPAVVDGVSSPNVLLMMRTHGQKTPPLMPRTPWWQFPDDHTTPAGDKIIDWLAKRFELGRKFGVARQVLHWLNVNCENGHQVRYMFPAVLHLCKMGRYDKMDRWINKYAPFKPCKYTPSVSPQLKQGIQDASALLTMLALIDQELPEATRTEVLIDDAGLPSFDFNGQNIARM